MSNSVDLRQAIRDCIADLALPYSLQWNNRPFDIPDNSPWMRVSVLNGLPSEIALNKTNRIDGVLQFDLFVPKGSGDLVHSEISDTIRQGLPNNGQTKQSGNVKVSFRNISEPQFREDDRFSRSFIDAQFYCFVDRTA